MRETPTSAMILAAGWGMRLRPLTLKTPKPLIPVAGRSMLDRVLDAACQAGIENFVVNVHHLADQVEDHLAAREGLQIQISDERARLLETGGGVTKALPLLQGDAFFVINSDNFWIDRRGSSALARMIDLWRKTNRDDVKALLLVTPKDRAFGYRGAGDFSFSFRKEDFGTLQRRGNEPEAPFIFTGVQILDRQLFDLCAAEPFSLNRIYDLALRQAGLYGLILEGQWFHIGDPEALSQAEGRLSHGGIDCDN